jgi:hypothetical protein
MRRLSTGLLLTAGIALATCPLLAATEPEDGVGPAGLSTGRAMHTATLLPDGRVLVVGGISEDEAEVAEAELWDPLTGHAESTGSLAQTRWGSSASLLPDGRVLIVGGGTQSDPAGERSDAQGPFSLTSAEVWGSETGFSPTGSMAVARRTPTATTLPDGRVLVVGGTENEDPVAAEIWDPATGTFWPTGVPLVARNWGNTATMLPDGRVLIVGSDSVIAEAWDPETGRFEETGQLDAGRVLHTTSMLPDGRILVVGGFGFDETDEPTLFDSAAAWDPATGVFVEVGSMAVGRVDHRAAVLPNGKVVISGGLGYEGDAPDPEADIGPSLVTLVEVFDPVTDSFSAAGRISEGREYHTATALPDGRVVLIGGGDHEAEELAGLEIWEP